MSQAVLNAVRARVEASDDPAGVIAELRALLHELSPTKSQPIDLVRWVPIDKVSPNSYNPNSVAKIEMGLLYTSIRHDGYCVEEATPVLKADLTWALAGCLVAGDRLIAFDEFATGNGLGRKQRRYRTAEVISNFVEDSPLVQVHTDRGDLLATPDHPFLAKRCYGKGHHGSEWIAADTLRPDDTVMHLMAPWGTDRSWEAGWLAGFLDGEGTMAKNQAIARGNSQTFRLSGYQRPGVTADRMIAEMTKRAITKVFTIDRTGHAKWNSMVMARVDRLAEIMRLLGMVRPDRLIRAGGEFWDGCALSGKLKDGANAIVRSVLPAGRGRIARLSTTTGTYIANGFAVHNTQPTVTVYDAENDRYVIVDGFHRYYTMKTNRDIYESTGGLLPVVVIDKSINDRMASTVRHNRARGKHSVQGMSSMVFQMLENGWEDAAICNELGMSPEELLRLKHITGFSKLFKDATYGRSWTTPRQIRVRKQFEAGELPDVPQDDDPEAEDDGATE